MSETTVLSLGSGHVDDRPVVDVYGKTFKVRAITRSVQKKLQSIDIEMRKFMQTEADDASEDDADRVVELLAGGMDALLEIDGAHRTPAKKLVMEKWNADVLSLEEIRRFFDALQEQSAASRPT